MRQSTIKLSFLIALVAFFYGSSSVVLQAEENNKVSTENHFPIDSFISLGEILNLSDLSEIEINSIMIRYLKLEKTASNQELKGPVNLALGYLYIEMEKSELAIKTLEKYISENSPLGDYFIELLGQALLQLSESKLKEKKYSEALKNLDRAIKLRLQLVQNFPSSPFVKTLEIKLSELERMKGRVYLAQRKFEKSISFYRRALARKSESPEWRSRALIELAELYQSLNKIPEAIEVFTMLASNDFNDENIEKTKKQFVSKYENEIRGNKLAFQGLMAKEWSSESEIKQEEIADNRGILGVDEEFLNNWRMLSFAKFVEKSKFILINFPGTKNAIQVLNIVVQKLSDRLAKYSWSMGAQKLASLLPPEKLNELALSLWRRGRSGLAAKCYRLIVDKYPMETRIVHKSLFFLGRIFEDKKEFLKAQGYYRRLVESYPYGVYTGAAAFKIPWIHRLQSRRKEAIEGFKNAIIFYKSSRFEALIKDFSVSTSFLPASYFWLAQTAESMKGFETRDYYLSELIKEHPFSFYALIGRTKIGKGTGDTINPKNYGLLQHRDEILGDREQAILYRAEALISVGLFHYGVEELERLNDLENASNGFLFYLASLYFQGQSYKGAIGFIWEIIDREDKDMISLNLAKTLFPQVYWELVSKHAKKRKMSPFLALALSRQESAFQKDVISKANAVGLMQLLPQTAREVARSSNIVLPDEESLKDPKVNIPLGIEYLKGLLTEFGGNIPFALAAYNAGPHKVRSWKRIRNGLGILEFIESIPYRETRDYVKKVLRNYLIYLALYQDRSIKDVKKILINSFN